MAAVAQQAGVSPDTVYKRFGSKIVLLKNVLDVAVGGDDDEVALLERAAPETMRIEPDQRRQIVLFAYGMAAQLDRLAPLDAILRSAAAVDPEAAALRDDIQLRQRRQAMYTVVGWIAAHGNLRDGLSQEDATAAVWTLTSPEVHAMFRQTWGWSSDQYAAWLEATLTANLLSGGPSTSDPAAGRTP